MNTIDTELMALILSPVINHTEKQGDDIRYEPEFEQVEAEVAKLTSMHKTDKPDWLLIRKISAELIINKSKDLRLLCWFLFSYLKTDLIQHTPSAIQLLTEFVDEYASVLYPVKSRQQTAVLNWLFDRIDFENNEQLEKQNAAFISTLKTALNACDEVFDRHYGDDAPNVRGKIQLLNQIEARNKADAAKQAQTPANLGLTTPSSAAPTIPAIDGVSVTTDADLLRSVRQVQDAVRSLVSHYLQKDVQDPRALLMTRSITWLQVLSIPPSNADGVTSLKPLSANKLQEYQSRIAQKDFSALLPELEISLSKAPFWFDGHYLCAQALIGIGQPSLAEMCKQILSVMLDKFPAFKTLKFDDGTAFVSDETHAWLASQTADVGDSLTITSTSNGETAHWQSALNDACAVIQNDPMQFSQTVGEFQLAMQQSRAIKDKAHWLYATAILCQKFHKHDLANICFKQLKQHLEQFNIAAWDPDFSISVYVAWKKSLEKTGDKNNKNILDVIKEELFKLDITKAF